MDNTSNAQAIIDAIEKANKEATIVSIERGNQYKANIVAVPDGLKLQSLKPLLDEYLPFPERRKGTSQHRSIDSFIAHVNRTRDANSAVFFDDSNAAEPTLTVVYDYDEAANVVSAIDGDFVPDRASPQARHRQHTAAYRFILSDEWKAWTAAQSAMPQTHFAQLLEDRILDVLHPDQANGALKQFAANLGIDLATPARMLELSRGLSVRVDQRVEKIVNLSTGEGQMNFSESHNDKDGGPLKLPGGFGIQIPVFKGDAAYQVPVRLRYRVQGGAVVWTLSLYRTDVFFRDAAEIVCKKVADETGLHVFQGSPEKSA